MQKIKEKISSLWEKKRPREIQSIIMVTSSLISILSVLLIGALLYAQFSRMSRNATIQNTEKMMNQTVESMENYLMSMRRISDTAYYHVVKELDVTDQIQNIQEKINLLYETNKGDLRSIALYNSYGSLIMAEPLAVQKEDPAVTRQSWFSSAAEEIENMHFSTPHIQHLFDDGTKRYYWVLSLSRAVEITSQGESNMGVLLIDMDFDRISDMMQLINEAENGQYYYLCDRDGNIIYHPRQTQLERGIYRENSRSIAVNKDGIYDDLSEGVRRKVLIDSIGYTGWKLVSVIPETAFSSGMLSIRYFVAVLMLFMLMMLVVINRVISEKISSPIRRLNRSVEEYEAGEKPEIYVGGSLEIRHLGLSVQNSYEQIDELMKEIVTEQNERRKSELAALQSQINPHFLYNTLDSIMWMVEGERNEEASYMISQLAKLLRISLSKGYTVISIQDELLHAQSYMNIQKIRYKNAFSVSFDIQPEVKEYCVVKLVLQPILENAINYGIDPLEDCGEITVSGEKKDGEIWLSVRDNGVGMTQEQADELLSDKDLETVRPQPSKKGSGIGLRNVHHRIQILFGREYGLKIESEPDEGTTVYLHFPAIRFDRELQKEIEKGKKLTGEESLDEKTR